MRGVFRSERSGKPRISKPKTKGVRGVRLFLWGRQAGNPVPSHSLSNTIFLYTDIGRTRPDRPFLILTHRYENRI